ncbi:MAG TPA: thiamine-binding protein [Bacteroidia bacterium]|nr:thiamine-binding protein [Bacteroidia bacterium]
MKINAAIQLLPFPEQKSKYILIDEAIALIAQSGLAYKVCPFETVVEGESEAVYALINNIQQTCLASGCDELLLNIKIHAANRDLHFSEKLEKY